MIMARPAFVLFGIQAIGSARPAVPACVRRTRRASVVAAFLCLLGYCPRLFAQNPDGLDLDSLEHLLTIAPHDTDRSRLLMLLSHEYVLLHEDEKAIDRTTQVIELAKHTTDPSEVRIKLRKAAASAHVNLGTVLEGRGEHAAALDHLYQALRIRETLGRPLDRAVIYMAMANIYDRQGNSLKAFDNYQKCLDAMLASGDKRNIGYVYENLGTYYSNQEELDKSLDNYTKGLAYLKEVGDESAIALAYGNLGRVQRKRKEYDKSLEYLEESQQMFSELDDQAGLNISCNALGQLYLEMSTGGNMTPKDGSEIVLQPTLLDAAEQYLQRSLALAREQGNNNYVLYDLAELGDVARLRDDTEQAVKYYEEALGLAGRMKMASSLPDIYRSLSSIHERKGRLREALRYHRLFAQAEDSVFDKDKQKQLGRLEAKIEYDREATIAKQERERADALLNARLEKQTLQRNGLIGGFGLMLLLAVMSYRSYRNKQRAHTEVQYQKALVEEKNKDITDSIRYARRIQEAILPSDATLITAVPDSFILYRPKEIVSGDLYWFEQRGDVLLLAVVDCTGHGVPGALMTIVGNNALLRAVNEAWEEGPAGILDRLNWIIHDNLRRSYERKTINDGMDISLCMLDLKQRTLRFAGADQTLLLIRGFDVVEVQGDKHPVGVFAGDAPAPFTGHQLQLEEGDSLYLFTDGFMGQFGREPGKTLTYEELKDLLLSIQDNTMQQQRSLISNAFTIWMGDQEQVDDVCMLGLRINQEDRG